jgi:hypothetical protein
VRLDFGLTLGCQDLDNEAIVSLTQRLSIHGADFVVTSNMTCIARHCGHLRFNMSPRSVHPSSERGLAEIGGI